MARSDTHLPTLRGRPPSLTENGAPLTDEMARHADEVGIAARNRAAAGDCGSYPLPVFVRPPRLGRLRRIVRALRPA